MREGIATRSWLQRLRSLFRSAHAREAEAAGFDPKELEEFLDADRLPDTADPEFKERLRHELWDIVKGRDRG